MRDEISRDPRSPLLPVRHDARASGWPSLLVVDDDPQMLRTLTLLFEKRGFHVAPAADIAEAKRFFHRHKTWVLAIIDYHLPDGTGMELRCWLEEQSANPPPCLLMSGHASAGTLCAGSDFLAKPFTLEEIESRVRHLLHTSRS